MLPLEFRVAHMDVVLDLFAVVIVGIAAKGVAPEVVGAPDVVAGRTRIAVEVGADVVVVEEAAQILQLLVVAVLQIQVVAIFAAQVAEENGA